MSWFDEQAPQDDPLPRGWRIRDKTPGATIGGSRGTTAPTYSSPGTPVGAAPTTQTYSDAALQEILRRYPPTNEGIRQALEEANRTFGTSISVMDHPTKLDKLRLPDGRVVDAIMGAGGGSPSWGWIDVTHEGQGGPSGVSGGPVGGFTQGVPPGYEVGTFTGGGQYPLASLMAPGLMQPWTTPFKAPDDVTQQNDPGWQFRMREGLRAIERSAAARGTLLTGGTLKGLTRFAQDYASNEYDKVYGRQMGEYENAYKIFSNNQANQYNRLSGVAGMGQNAAAQTGTLGAQFAGAGAGALTAAGEARAAGQQGAGNVWGSMANNLGNTIGDYYWMNRFYPRAPSSPGGPATTTGYVPGYRFTGDGG